MARRLLIILAVMSEPEQTYQTSRQVCPYLGCFWDRTIHVQEADPDNRCFAKATPGLIASLLGARRNFRIVDITSQQAFCYSRYSRCQVFKAK